MAHPTGYFGYCEPHGKRLYADRKSAKAVIREIGDKGMRAYRCNLVAAAFHIGHMPQVVRSGEMTMREVYGPTTEEVTNP